jgi:hypothetical protein
MLASLAIAAPCEPLEPVPDAFQVAWVSPVARTVGNGTPLEVVRVSELRKLVERRGRASLKLLQGLGLAGRRDRRTWKVTVFDVQRPWLCRPMEGEEGEDAAGVAVCPQEWDHAPAGTRGRSHSGCGYQLDTMTGERTLDTFRILWRDAVSRGFCVLPWDRFLAGA